MVICLQADTPAMQGRALGAPGKAVTHLQGWADCQHGMGRGGDLLPRDVQIPQSWGMVVKLYSHYRFGDVNVGN